MTAVTPCVYAIHSITGCSSAPATPCARGAWWSHHYRHGNRAQSVKSHHHLIVLREGLICACRNKPNDSAHGAPLVVFRVRSLGPRHPASCIATVERVDMLRQCTAFKPAAIPSVNLRDHTTKWTRSKRRRLRIRSAWRWPVGAQIVGQCQERHRGSAARTRRPKPEEPCRLLNGHVSGNAGLVGRTGHVEQRPAGQAEPPMNQRAGFDIAHQIRPTTSWLQVPQPTAR